MEHILEPELLLFIPEEQSRKKGTGQKLTSVYELWNMYFHFHASLQARELDKIFSMCSIKNSHVLQRCIINK